MNKREPLKFRVKFIGEHILDKRSTQSMITWICAKAAQNSFNKSEDLILEISDSVLTGISVNKQNCLFTYSLQNISHFEQWSQDKNVFTFTILEEVNSTLTLHIYRTIDEQISERIVNCLKEEKDHFLESLQIVSKQYEVSLVHLIHMKIPLENVSSSLIDKFLCNNHCLKPNDNKEREELFTNALQQKNERSQSLSSFNSVMQAKEKITNCFRYEENNLLTHKDCAHPPVSRNISRSINPKNKSSSTINKDCLRKEKIMGNSETENNTNHKEITMSDLDTMRMNDVLEKNQESQTLLFLIGSSELLFINPDHKETSLKKPLHLVVECFQGRQNSDHFGLVCSNTFNDYICYVFQCKSTGIVNEIMHVLEKTFQNAHKSYLSNHVKIFCCENCPMFWYHCVCESVNKCETPEVIRNEISSTINTLKNDEQQDVLKILQGVQTSLQNENELLMHSLLELSSKKQEIHDKYSHKTKKSGNNLISYTFNKLRFVVDNLFHQPPVVVDKNDRKLRSLTIDNSAVFRSSQTSEIYNDELNHNRKKVESFSQSLTDSGNIKKTTKRWRHLWKWAINEHVMAIRMEQRNKRNIQQSIINVSEKEKLNYSDPFLCGYECLKQWKQIIDDCDNNPERINRAVKNGVPKEMRGDIWLFLSRLQKCKRNECNFDLQISIGELSKHLSEEPHQIIIDLSRTFPDHAYFSQPFGEGQLSLFNVLKAYSLADKEVGYCQGIAFIAGILLLHTNEDNAFELLKHILISNGLREQYTPEMSLMNIQLSRLSQLLLETNPNLYKHFKKHKISTSLYASPWFLTLFASQFSIGFVARLFDVLFLLGVEAIYRLSLSVLQHFKERLLKCNSFETISQTLKLELQSVNSEEAKSIFEHVFTLDISDKLFTFCGEETDYF